MGMLTSLIASFATGEAAAALGRARRAAIMYTVAMVAACCGAGFLVAAAYIWAAERYGAIEAALGFGGGFIVLAGFILLAHSLTSGHRARRRAKRRNADMTAIGITTAIAVLPTLLRGRSGLALLLGPVAALVAYEIYRENAKPGTGPEDSDKA